MAAFGPFSGKAAHPELQPMVDTLLDYMRSNNLSANALSLQAFGPMVTGKTSPIIYTWAHGKASPNLREANILLEKIGLDLTPWASTKKPRFQGEPRVRKPKESKPSAKQALVAYNQAVALEHVPVPVKATEPNNDVVNFNVTADGKAHIRFEWTMPLEQGNALFRSIMDMYQMIRSRK